MTLSVVYITSREFPRWDWFIDSLRAQMLPGDPVKIIVVDLYAENRARREHLRQTANGLNVWHTTPMPNVWQGKHRITKCDWWAIATAKNTGLCLAGTEWVAFCDDRSCLGDKWLVAVKEAMKGNYAVAGAYQKVHNLVVENGLVKTFTDIDDGHDTYRAGYGHPERALKCPGWLMFGCTQALPVEWALKVNGFDETCNSVGLEDTMFGHMLANNGYPICYDRRMLLWEDRTPGQLGSAPKRRDKGVSPADKSHAVQSMLCGLKRAMHPRNIREIRSRILNGGKWPVPTEPTTDFWDNQMLSQMEP